MDSLIIQKIYREFKDTKTFTLPPELQPCPRGVNLLRWMKQLADYYREQGIVVRPFDELPPLRLSAESGLETTVQDVHKFIISDLNLISADIRRQIFTHAVSHANARESWQYIAPLLSEQFEGLDRAGVVEELTWTFSPVAEVLQALTWFFMEREGVVPPEGTCMVSERFPYYRWGTAEGRQSLWAPENRICRREWLAFDLYGKILSTDG